MPGAGWGLGQRSAVYLLTSLLAVQLPSPQTMVTRLLLGLVGASLISSTAHAARPVPVELQVVDPGTFEIVATADPDQEILPSVPGLVQDWSLPATVGAGSGHFEVVVTGNGHLEIHSS